MKSRAPSSSPDSVPAEIDEYFRRVHQVVSPAGVQNASELNIDFDPSFQRLVIHDAVVIRGNKRINFSRRRRRKLNN